MKKLCFILLSCMMSLLSIQCDAQAYLLEGKADVDTIAVGQPFDYQLSLTINKDYLVDWKQFEDTLGKSIDVINVGEIKTTPTGNLVVMTQKLTLTSFDTGYVYVPQIGISYSKDHQDSVPRRIYSDEYEIFVRAMDIDTTQAFKQIKAPISQSITAKEIFPWVVVIIGICGLAYLVFWLIKHRKRSEVVVVEKKKPKIPAIVTARAKLTEMKDKELWNSSDIKDYYTDLTGIAREYLEGQFDIDAIEMTTDEIVGAVGALNLKKTTKEKLQETLTTADLVKFAKANPSAEQNLQSFNDINGFVEDSYVYFQEEEKKMKEEENK